MRRQIPFAVGFAAFFICFVGLASVLGTCADGWSSPSIGSQGACSWHGGVSCLRLYIAGLVSLGTSFLSSKIAAILTEKDRSNAAVPQIFDAGAHVYHPHFGYGVVMRWEGDGSDAKLLISFGGREKKLHLGTAIKSGLRVTGT